jgi:hypothetical protein
MNTIAWQLAGYKGKSQSRTEHIRSTTASIIYRSLTLLRTRRMERTREKASVSLIKAWGMGKQRTEVDKVEVEGDGTHDVLIRAQLLVDHICVIDNVS